jgi:hypothetical protein
MRELVIISWCAIDTTASQFNASVLGAMDGALRAARGYTKLCFLYDFIVRSRQMRGTAQEYSGEYRRGW